MNRLLAGFFLGGLASAATAQVLGVGVGVGVGAGAGGGVSISVPLPQALQQAVQRRTPTGALEPPAQADATARAEAPGQNGMSSSMSSKPEAGLPAAGREAAGAGARLGGAERR